MNEYKLDEVKEQLHSIVLNIIYSKPEDRIITPSYNFLNDLKNKLNELFAEDDQLECTEISYSLNTDNQFFGIRINPEISAEDTLKILLTDEKIRFRKYKLELDSKIFDVGLDADELVATLIYEITSQMGSFEIVDKVRGLIDLNLLADDDVILIRDSANYTQLITYAIKDTMYKLSSIMFVEDPDNILANRYVQVLELDEPIISAQGKILSSTYGSSESTRDPKTIILDWIFIMYRDMKYNTNTVKDTLKDAKDFTGSKLDRIEIDKTIKAVDNIAAVTIIENCSLDKAFEQKNLYSLNELSLFKSLKKNGLRSVEDDLYEFALRVKNCETEEDAMYILRGINTRLNILEDYLYNSPELTDAERKHWEAVSKKYRELRELLSKKKIFNKKQYGLFFDYSKLDNLDDNSENEY